MKNEELKNAYLKSREGKYIYSNTIEKIFDRVGKYEEENNKDICMFNTKEILVFYEQYSEDYKINSFDYLSNIHSQLSSYAAWCLKNQKSYPELAEYRKNNYVNVHSDDIHFIIGDREADKLITREELLDMCKEVPNPSDAFILIALFEGLHGRDYAELRELKWTDFDGNTVYIVPGRIPKLYEKVTIPNKRKLTVSDELINYANKCRFNTEYHSLVSDVITELADEDFIIKRTEKARNCNKQPKLTRRIVEMFNYLGRPNLTALDIRNSGKIHFINERCKEVGISGKEYVFGKYYSEVGEKFNDNIQRQTFWNKFHSRLTDIVQSNK